MTVGTRRSRKTSESAANPGQPNSDRAKPRRRKSSQVRSQSVSKQEPETAVQATDKVVRRRRKKRASSASVTRVPQIVKTEHQNDRSVDSQPSVALVSSNGKQKTVKRVTFREVLVEIITERDPCQNLSQHSLFSSEETEPSDESRSDCDTSLGARRKQNRFVSPSCQRRNRLSSEEPPQRTAFSSKRGLASPGLVRKVNQNLLSVNHQEVNGHSPDRESNASTPVFLTDTSFSSLSPSPDPLSSAKMAEASPVNNPVEGTSAEEAPKKNQKPSEPPVTFREFKVLPPSHRCGQCS